MFLYHLAIPVWIIIGGKFLVCQVSCQECEENDVRLVGGRSELEGQVQICKGNWKEICSNGWDLKDAVVTCRQLGFSAAQGKKKSLQTIEKSCYL